MAPDNALLRREAACVDSPDLLCCLRNQRYLGKCDMLRAWHAFAPEFAMCMANLAASCLDLAWILLGSCLDLACILPGSCLDLACILPGSCLDLAWICLDVACNLSGSCVALLPLILRPRSPVCPSYLLETNSLVTQRGHGVIDHETHKNLVPRQHIRKY